ncbi:MAG: inositol monophosphatase [Acetobacteraceae bacterium]|nr:inositol monophosphatase [Acetobacteraceae bacterium]
MTRPELAELVSLVRAVGRAEVMPRFRALRPEDVQAKTGPLDLVTVADEAAEAQLTKALRARHPESSVVGEEATAKDPALLDRIAGAELCFILDPIDGTSNFAAGLPLFGMMLAVTRFGRTVAAVIHDPVGDDTAVALAGEGAWMERCDGGVDPLRVAAPAPVSAMSGALSWRFMPEPVKSRVCARLPRLAGAWDYRCAAHQYRLAAAGACQFLVYHRLMPWDHAAGELLFREAGGHVARLDGSPYSPASTQGGLIAAPDQASWTALRDALFGPE